MLLLEISLRQKIFKWFFYHHEILLQLHLPRIPLEIPEGMPPGVFIYDFFRDPSRDSFRKSMGSFKNHSSNKKELTQSFSNLSRDTFRNFTWIPAEFSLGISSEFSRNFTRLLLQIASAVSSKKKKKSGVPASKISAEIH